MKNVRDAAVGILLKTEKENAYSNLSLASAEYADADPRDRALLSSLVYGVLEHRETLDYNISLYLSSPLKKLHPRVLNILRTGALQIFYMDKIPDRAAVSEAVSSAKRMKAAYAAPLINAVLRKAANTGLVFPDKENKTEYLRVRYSCPGWLIGHFIQSYGDENAERILAAFEGRRPLFCRINPLAPFDVAQELEKEGVRIHPTDVENCFTLENTGDITALSAFRRGGFHIQDMSSQICCAVLGAKPGETVLDCCSAPGGKAFTAAEKMNGSGMLIANDIYEHKCRLIEEGAARLGLRNIRTVCSDASSLGDRIKDADRVLCDVPCSGLGVIGRKPEIRYKPQDELKDLPAVQYAILDNCSRAVKKGGVLVYSTCTLNPAENEDVCDRFLAAHPEFSVSSGGYYGELTGGEKYKTFFPEKNGGDGFFIARFIRTGS